MGDNFDADTNQEKSATLKGFWREWDDSKNGLLTDAMPSLRSKSRVWWRCERHHDWAATVSDRAVGHGCPFCAGVKAWPGFNDMASTHPLLAAQWHPSKNFKLTPQKVIAGSNKRVWWVCGYGHEWEARCADRVKGSGCPVCSGRQVLSGFNDLGTLNPNLAAEWHPRLNGDAMPNQIRPGTKVKFWWLCPSGHEYEAVTKDRFSGSGCPICAGKRVISGVNDLATTHPGLAAEFHPLLNGTLTTAGILAGTKIKVHWQCKVGHFWVASVQSRSSRGLGCPYCAGVKVLAGFNDMATTHPHLTLEWNLEKNGNLTPSDVLAGTNQAIWWICDLGHEWRTTGNSRVSGTNCPSCSASGFDPSAASTLYFIANKALAARKIGITNTSSSRLKDFKRDGWQEVILFHRQTGEVISAVERVVLGWLRVDQKLPQHLTKDLMRKTRGETETFSEEGPSNLEIIERIGAEFARLEG